MGDGSFSYSLTTFSKTGTLTQIDHALERVSRGRTSIGIRARNGVVIATDKKVPSVLVDSEAVSKIEMIHPSAGFVYSGMGPDYRVLVRAARKSAQRYRLQYQESQPVLQVVTHAASVMQEYTQSGGVRPFGVSLLVAGSDHNGPQLFQVDPSGAYFGWKATAIGKNYREARAFLDRRYNEEMELDDAVHTALLTLRENFEGELTQDNVEVGVVGQDGKFRTLTASEVRDYLEEAS
eukprot:CAMPEP_0198428540 /NCGR_PEP_ID=MMETSP1452-20131203/6618_1 /TAXON_ID=1181717 /ORGANISM="Synchroma pusillum, Strain CCMP3072" /LENGTH=235 /DNA_ID=CAMNT_0044148935 /DNA_START=36 /DNA_END=743 /DNA_ORIENTATION=+